VIENIVIHYYVEVVQKVKCRTVIRECVKSTRCCGILNKINLLNEDAGLNLRRTECIYIRNIFLLPCRKSMAVLCRNNMESITTLQV
jgi:hypothetical protein